MLTPTERHRTGLSLWAAGIGVVALIAGIVYAAEGSWIGVACLGIAAFLARDVYLSYKAGNFPGSPDRG
jgi:hypothetical protein